MSSYYFENLHVENLFAEGDTVAGSYFHKQTTLPSSLSLNPIQLYRYTIDSNTTLVSNIMKSGSAGRILYLRQNNTVLVWVVDKVFALKNTHKTILNLLKSSLNDSNPYSYAPISYIEQSTLTHNATPITFPFTLESNETKEIVLSFPHPIESMYSYINIMNQTSDDFHIFSKFDPHNATIEQTETSYKNYICIQNGETECTLCIHNKKNERIEIPSLTWVVPETHRSNMLQSRIVFPKGNISIEVNITGNKVNVLFATDLVSCEMIQVFTGDGDKLAFQRCVYKGFTTRATWLYHGTTPIENQTFIFYKIKMFDNTTYSSDKGLPFYIYPVPDQNTTNISTSEGSVL